MSSHSSYLTLTHCSITIVSFADIEFSEVFLSTFHTFVSPMELMDALIKRFFCSHVPTVSMFMCVLMCMCLHIRIHTYTHTYVPTYVYIHRYLDITTTVCIQGYIHTYVILYNVHTYVCTWYCRYRVRPPESTSQFEEEPFETEIAIPTRLRYMTLCICAYVRPSI